MSSRTHQIELSEDLERRLNARAAAAGTDAESFIRSTIEEKLQSPRSFREIVAPLHEALVDEDASAEPLDAMFERLRESVHSSGREPRR